MLLILALFTSYMLQQKKVQAVHETVISIFAALSVGATLSATDPVTILAIFNTYKVDPKLYTIIFGESILNDAIAIVLFETAQRYKQGGSLGGRSLTIFSLFEGVGIFFVVFIVSLLIGVVVGIGTALGLKYTLVRRYPKIESCLIILVAYSSYFFSNGCHMSGIVSLLFCGITLKHYAYYNMSRRTQLTTKYLFQVLAQLSENFIFIYLGLTLFTETELSFKPLFILVTIVGICLARWAAVFPLSRAINWVIRYRAKRRGKDVADELPYSYQAMLFWAGLRGAVGVALAAGLTGEMGLALRATVLVVVVLTVIIFGGTTARMLEILGIRTGVVEEIDSDDEFDIETTAGGTYYKRAGTGLGHNPRPSGNFALSPVDIRSNGQTQAHGSYSSGNAREGSPSPNRAASTIASRKNSIKGKQSEAEQILLGGHHDGMDDSDVESDASDLPPAVRRTTRQRLSPNLRPEASADPSTATYPTSGVSNSHQVSQEGHLTASGAISQLFNGTTDDHAEWFRQLDEGYIKPHLLLDQGRGSGGGHGGS
ncbi:monovalent cation:H+ antiporter, CPA1 (nhx1) [Glutinoglossum americanum]|uniref:Sodium/hydrogen exchanger n=1 Tax=Glutinoglossum americanum TaxID=1670608 RepID=A0A9P8HTT9_9PEZI|nr:monovalent cation:H+ antiporter, CPA1 (nhx1) [Glutinoglossum americanum]